MRVRPGWCVAWLVLTIGGLSAVATADEPGDDGLIVEVAAGAHHRVDTPVVADLGVALTGPIAVDDLTTGVRAPGQTLPDQPRSVAWMLKDLPAQATRRFRIRASGKLAAPQPLTTLVHGRQLVLRRHATDILAYAIDTIDPPAGLDPIYRRSGFVHPLRTPSGRVVTADFPADHAHQHGVFFAWVNTTFEGRKVDFWNQAARQGQVRHVDLIEATSGPVFAEFRTRLGHEVTPAGKDPTPALDETWTVRVYNVPGRHLVDFVSSQRCAGARPLEINKYHYGGFGIRGTSAWFDPKANGENPPDPSRSGASDFLTSDGKHRTDANHTRPRWVDLSGTIDGDPAGLTVLDSPANFRFPQPVRIHPNKPYFAFSPMVEGPFRIEPGHDYVSRYRLDIHDGFPDKATIERLWDDYADPPKVAIVAGRHAPGAPRP